MATALTSLALLTGCGGGNTACSTQQTLGITGTAYPKAVVQTKLGVAMTPLTPVLAGIPESCQGEKRFELSDIVSRLPKGIVLDARTGTISGTPTELTQIVTSGAIQTPFPSTAFISLQLPGYSAISLGSVSFQVTKD
jgi:Putative Ig domain